MKKFLSKIVFYFLLLGVLLALYITLIYFRPELVDNFYYRFTTEKAGSLILGTSRSAQGIIPGVINERLFLTDNKIINHSFAIGPSSFGPNYFKEVKQKLREEAKHGVFIISVDPWSLATGSGNVNDDPAQFYEVEKKLFVGNLNSSSSNPNYDYLINHWSDRFTLFGNAFKHLINYKGLLELHKDGWLEVSITMDSLQLSNRIKSSTEEYRAKDMILSNTRLDYLSQIIVFLQAKGAVYLVRLPVSKPMCDLESERFAGFDDQIEHIAANLGVPYFNFINDSGKYKTIDTHHLYKTESARITQTICDSILENLNSKRAHAVVIKTGDI